MNSRIYIGIDNGTSGTIAIVGDNIDTQFYKTPIKKQFDYTKAKKNISRLEPIAFLKIINMNSFNRENITVVMERPMVNPTRFRTTMTALRCFEAELILIESLNYRITYIDSKQWQKEMLPKGINGDELKKASKDIGDRLFPQFKDFNHADRDALLIAEYARKKNL